MSKTEAPYFAWPLRVFIEDTDAGGIVYYVNYLKFMERARTEYLRSLGFGREAIFNESVVFVVKQVDVDYKLPARLDDELEATAKVIEKSGASIVFEQQILKKTPEGNELLCIASVKIACVDRQSLKPKRIPKMMREALN